MGIDYLSKEGVMSQTQTMTLDEKLAIGCKAVELRKAGDEEGYFRLIKKIPIFFRQKNIS